MSNKIIINLFSKMALGTLMPKIFKTLSLTINTIQSNQKLVQFMANVAQEEI
nr:hypothetical protein [uncultured Bacteroides sp.]